MKFIFIVFVLVIGGQVECNNGFAGFEINKEVDYTTACGEPLDGEFPWLVNVFKTTLSQSYETVKKFLCSGNIIDKYTVVLPAHCVSSYNNRGLSIEAGKTTFLGRTKGTKEYTVRNVLLHPNFKLNTNTANIALLKLADPIEFSSYIHPICLTNDTTKFNAIQFGVVPTWTFLYEGENEDVLKTVHLPVLINNDECIQSDHDFLSQLNEHSFCAGAINEHYKLCKGSSGMGLALIEEIQIKFIWYLKGLLTIAKSDPKYKHECAPGYRVFIDVFAFYDWIIENKNSK